MRLKATRSFSSINYSMSEIKYAITDEEINFCWEVVRALRPHLEQRNYLSLVRSMMQEGYQMIYIGIDSQAVAFAGFRSMQMLYSGKIIYIDDLSTLPEHRGKGYAGLLLDFIHKLAADTGKKAVHLDSGYQRNEAHRLYLNNGYKLASHHFVKEL